MYGTWMKRHCFINYYHRHHKNPHCFKGWNPETIVSYYFNTNAWMTMDIFSDWLLKLNNYLRIIDRKILLTLDNAGGHNVSDDVKKQLTHITLEYFDPNVTSHIQPLDMGIIRSSKAYYRKKLVRHCLTKIEEQGKIVMPTLKEAINMIKSSWKNVRYNISICIHSLCNIYLFLGNKRNNSKLLEKIRVN